MNNIKPATKFIKPDNEYRIADYYFQLTGEGYELLINSRKKWYYLDGLLHRENAPAIIYTDGYQAWYIHHKRYNLNGPAIINSDNTKSYYIDDKKYSKIRYCKELMKCKFCKYQCKNKEDFLVHCDYEEEKGNLICQQMFQYIEKLQILW